MKSKSKLNTWAIWIGLLLGVLVIYPWLSSSGEVRESFDTFLADVEQERVDGIQFLSGGEMRVLLRDSDEAYLVKGRMAPETMEALDEQGVWFEPAQESWWGGIGVWLVVLAVILVAALIWLRKAQATRDSIFSFGKSRARIAGESSGTGFVDVGGCEDAKAELGDIVHYLRDPGAWRKAGARLPRGILLEGPPGCGKTLLARALAGETKSKFFEVSATEFVEIFGGAGAARVRDLFQTAAKEAPAVVFIDELDAVGMRRGATVLPGFAEWEHTLNQLLASIDGFEPASQVVVLGATNRPEVLDKALLRPGRFDRRIVLELPDCAERLEILAIHARGKQLADEVSLEALAERLQGFNGADLESLLNDAALRAVRRSREAAGAATEIRLQDLEDALARRRQCSSEFSAVDSVLIESSSQVAEPSGRAVVRLVLGDGSIVEGELVWANTSFLKVRAEGGEETLVPKRQIVRLEALEGTEGVAREQIFTDRWRPRREEVA